VLCTYFSETLLYALIVYLLVTDLFNTTEYLTRILSRVFVFTYKTLDRKCVSCNAVMYNDIWTYAGGFCSSFLALLMVSGLLSDWLDEMTCQVCSGVCELPEVYLGIWCLVFWCDTVGDVHRWSAAVGRNDWPRGVCYLTSFNSVFLIGCINRPSAGITD